MSSLLVLASFNFDIYCCFFIFVNDNKNDVIKRIRFVGQVKDTVGQQVVEKYML